MNAMHTMNEINNFFNTLPKWNVTEFCGYVPKTTFWRDFSIADLFGDDEVKYTFKRAFNEWKYDAVYLTELVMVLNHKSWEHYDRGNTSLSQLYVKFYQQADAYACENLKGEDLSYYLDVTD